MYVQLDPSSFEYSTSTATPGGKLVFTLQAVRRMEPINGTSAGRTAIQIPHRTRRRIAPLPLLFLAACASAPGRGEAAAESPSAAPDLLAAQLARGESVYRERCRVCHDLPECAGEELSPRILASYYSARSLFEYVDLAMPYDSPGSLSVEEYWAVTAYLIDDRDLARLEVPLAADGAEEVRLTIGPDG